MTGLEDVRHKVSTLLAGSSGAAAQDSVTPGRRAGGPGILERMSCLPVRYLFLLCGWTWLGGGQVPSAVPMSLRTARLSSDKSRAQGPLQTLLSAKVNLCFK